jgi:RNA polymerase sigma-70 factor, ECF subfamily
MPGLLEPIDLLTGIVRISDPDDKMHDLEREVVALFDELRDRMLRYLLGFGLSMADSEEIVQDSFLALFLHLRKGRSRRNLRSWLFRVAHNLALKNRQSSHRKARYLIDGHYATCGSIASPEDEFSQTQTQQRLQSVFQALPERGQRCLSLRAEGFTYREIAEVLGISLGAVAISLARALARFSDSGKEAL